MLPRVIVVTRPTELQQLIARHATVGQAEFFLQCRGRDIAVARARHAVQEAAVAQVAAAIPTRWRRAWLDRSDLDRFTFDSDDLVVAVGQDGLVANVARFLDGQPVIGVNPDPDRYEGVLARYSAGAVESLLLQVSQGHCALESRTMVRACLTDGQELVAVNEVFIGHSSHQSARYVLGAGDSRERQSSSGVIVSTGTGATGWSRSIRLERRSAIREPRPTDGHLAFFVREAWPSVATGTSITEGSLPRGQVLTLTSEMDEGGTIFGDGVESDHLDFPWGERVEIGVAKHTLELVAA